VRAVDVVVVGGGPAGLSGALVLGRARRRVVLIDAGSYRNADATGGVHCYLGLDGVTADELRRRGRSALAEIPNVEVREGEVLDIDRDGDGFRVALADGDSLRARALLLATGLVDTLPPVPGVRELHGRRVFPCPYCDGWELRDRPLAAYSHPDDRGGRFALFLARWSQDVVLLTGAPVTFSAEITARLREAGIAIDERPVASLAEDGDALVVRFSDGRVLRRAALFYHLGAAPRSDLPARLGCELDRRGGVEVDRHEASTTSGVWVAGDATRDALLSIVAAGEGAAAAIAIHEWLVATRAG
jgi:thioredoxin reductase